MPELRNRGDYESRLLRRLAGASAAARQAALDALGNPPDATRITPELIALIEQTYSAAIVDELLSAFTAAARGMSALNLPYDLDEVLAEGTTWAAEYMPSLVAGLAQRRAAFLRRKIADASRLGLTYEQFAESVGRGVFGPAMAQTMAITEITVAVTAGEQAVARQMSRTLPGTLIPVHETANDDRVCPICGPRHERPITDGQYPPLHGGCRCWVNWEYQEG